MFRVANVFSDHMVLQREKEIRVFGTGTEGLCLQVTLTITDGSSYRATARVQEGKWMAFLPPQQAAVGCILEVEPAPHEKELHPDIPKTIYRDVAIGEVWLAGGQSNMEFELQNCSTGAETLQSGDNPGVRFYYTPKVSYKDAEFYRAHENSGWQLFGPESARAWSAVGYYFADRLSRDLEGVTVGIIGCNWGGTSASAWMSREALLEDKDTATYVAEYEEAIAGMSEEEQIRAYDAYVEYHTQWDKECGKLYAANPQIRWEEVEEKLGKCRYPGPLNCKNPFRPAGLYECMLQMVCPYTLRGFLYYQGESDDHKPGMYYKLFTRMIRQWREDFLDDTLPFLMVQLTMHRYQYDEDLKNWPIIREAQMKAYRTLKNTGIAVIIDCGEFNNIHPLNKKTVGERLELQALAGVYHKIEGKDAFGPLFAGVLHHERELELCFAYSEDGFVGEPLGFEVAGEDGCFVPADATICGTRIFLKAETVRKPLHARYLWTNFGPVTLFGANGLPVAPFCTCKSEK